VGLCALLSTQWCLQSLLSADTLHNGTCSCYHALTLVSQSNCTSSYKTRVYSSHNAVCTRLSDQQYLQLSLVCEGVVVCKSQGFGMMACSFALCVVLPCIRQRL
jgi:hypothetical protein